MPRSDTPWLVGCAETLFERRKRLNSGSWRSRSSGTSAGRRWMSCWRMTLTLAGMVPSCCSLRVGVTVTSSRRRAGWSTTSTLPAAIPCASDLRHSANPVARTISVTSPPAGRATENLPDASLVVCRSSPDATRTMTEAPAIAPPVESWTMPDMTAPASSPVCETGWASTGAPRTMRAARAKTVAK